MNQSQMNFLAVLFLGFISLGAFAQSEEEVNVPLPIEYFGHWVSLDDSGNASLDIRNDTIVTTTYNKRTGWQTEVYYHYTVTNNVLTMKEYLYLETNHGEKEGRNRFSQKGYKKVLDLNQFARDASNIDHCNDIKCYKKSNKEVRLQPIYIGYIWQEASFIR